MYASFSLNGSDSNAIVASDYYSPIDTNADVETLYHDRVKDYTMNLKDENTVDFFLNKIDQFEFNGDEMDNMIRKHKDTLNQKNELNAKVDETKAKTKKFEKKMDKFNTFLKEITAELYDHTDQVTKYLLNIKKNCNDLFQLYQYENQKIMKPLESQIRNANMVLQKTERFHTLMKDMVNEEILDKLKDKDPLTCKVCYERIVTNICIPCGHLYCDTCINTVTACHICKQTVNSRQKVYLC